MGEVRKELHRIRRALQEQEPQRPKDGDNQLYAALDRLMREQERFRDPNLTREQVAAELGTNKLYLSRAISEHCSMTFLEYTNHLRLECAKATLLCDHTTKIEAIAACSWIQFCEDFLPSVSEVLPPDTVRIPESRVVVQNPSLLNEEYKSGCCSFL